MIQKGWRDSRRDFKSRLVPFFTLTNLAATALGALNEKRRSDGLWGIRQVMSAGGASSA